MSLKCIQKKKSSVTWIDVAIPKMASRESRLLLQLDTTDKSLSSRHNAFRYPSNNDCMTVAVSLSAPATLSHTHTFSLCPGDCTAGPLFFFETQARSTAAGLCWYYDTRSYVHSVHLEKGRCNELSAEKRSPLLTHTPVFTCRGCMERERKVAERRERETERVQESGFEKKMERKDAAAAQQQLHRSGMREEGTTSHACPLRFKRANTLWWWFVRALLL